MSWANFWKTVKVIIKWGPVVAKGVRKAYEWIKELSPRARDWWRGKKIAIIGPTAAGKNSFFNRLQGLPIPKEHINTKALEHVVSFKLRRELPDGKTFEIDVKRSTNVGGEQEQRERFWLDACSGSDVIFYMLTLDDLKRGRFRDGNRVHDDLLWLARHFGVMKSSPKVHFLVNKIDLELKKGADYDSFTTELKPLIEEFDETVGKVFGRFRLRYTGISATSMLDDDIFNRSLVLILEAVYESVHRKKQPKARVGSSAS